MKAKSLEHKVLQLEQEWKVQKQRSTFLRTLRSAADGNSNRDPAKSTFGSMPRFTNPKPEPAKPVPPKREGITLMPAHMKRAALLAAKVI